MFLYDIWWVMANKQLKILKADRGQLRTQLTRFTKIINDKSNHGKGTELNAHTKFRNEFQ